MTNNNQLANRPTSTAIKNISNYMLSPEVKGRFEEMMGKGASYYLNQVMIVVSNSDKLQQCTPQSIFLAAMRAATLRLSVDPGQGQAWIIPYAGKATFQLGYKGVYELALRTNLYRFINVIDIFEGEELVENRLTGMHTLAGKRIGDKKIAYMLYFELVSGFRKTFVMTISEIEMHAQTYAAKAYNDPDSPWNSKSGREREKMMKKTVLSNGLKRWGRFNQGDLESLNQIDDEQGWTGADILDPDLLPAETKSDPVKIMSELGFGDETKSNPPAEPKVEETEKKTLRLEPTALKEMLTKVSATNKGKTLEQTKIGLIAVTIEIALSFTTNPAASRKQLLVFLTGKDSLTAIDMPLLVTLYNWLDPKKDTGGEWRADAMSQREIVAAFNACQPAQETLL